MESLGSRSIRGRDRERDRENTQKNSIQKYAQSLCAYVCSTNTFYTTPRRTDRNTTVLQCSLRSIYTNSQKYIPCGISSLTASRFLHRIGLPSHRRASRYSASASPIGPNRSGPQLLQPMRPMLSLSLNSSRIDVLLINLSSTSLHTTLTTTCIFV